MGNREQEFQELAKSYKDQAMDAFNEKQLGKTAELLQDAIHLYKVAGDDAGYLRSMNFLGVVYANMGDISIAVDYYLEALEIAKNKKMYGIAGLLYNNIGSRYQELNQHEKAIYYFKKAMDQQKKEECDVEDTTFRYFIFYLNLTMSYQKLNDLEQAQKYLKLMEQYFNGDWTVDFSFTVLMLQCSIYWETGRPEFMKQHLEELLQLAKELNMLNDYVQNVQELAGLFKKTGEYQCWYTLLTCVEDTAKQQNMVYYQLVSVEMWMDYYYTTMDMEKYAKLCIRHTELYQEQKIVTDHERVQNLDIRIALKEKEEQRKQAEAKAETDNLTEQGNRYRLEKDTLRLVEEAAAVGRRIAVGIVDIDCFKELNDTYGHNVGDACLRKVGRILNEAVEGHGSVYRFGGDEFVILIYDGDGTVLEEVGRRIQENLEEAAIENKNSKVSDKLTISQGYACIEPVPGKELSDFLEFADKALYYVKENGKNGYQIIREERK